MFLTPLRENLINAIRARDLETIREITRSQNFRLMEDLILSRILHQFFVPLYTLDENGDVGEVINIFFHLENERRWVEESLFFFEDHLGITLNDLPTSLVGQILETVIQHHSLLTLVSLREIGNLNPQIALEAGIIRMALQKPSVGLIYEIYHHWRIGGMNQILLGSDEEALLIKAHADAEREGNHLLCEELMNFYSSPSHPW